MITKIGKYEIVEELGHGSMGVVYKGFDPDIRRHVAIKVLLNSFHSAFDDKSLERFKREAQAAGSLNHTNIVSVYEFGVEQGTPYIVQEFVEGNSLNVSITEKKEFKLKSVVKIMVQLLTALDYSHKHGIVHRDIKPANILLMKNDTIKVADFGIAKVERSDLTGAGEVIGTPYYMSPEQITGRPIDGRSDLYASGIIMYQLLTTDLPFTGSMSNIMYKILNETPPKPSSVNPRTPLEFDGITLKALAKNPAERYKDAKDFLKEIRLAFDHLTKKDATAQKKTIPPIQTPKTLRAMMEAMIIPPAVEKRAQNYFKKALQLFEGKDYDGAAAELLGCIESRQGMAEAYFDIGVARQVQARYDEASINYDRAIKVSSGIAEAYLNKGIAAYDTSNYNLALSNLDKYLNFYPEGVRGLYCRAIVFIAMKRHKEAIDDLDSAIRCNSRFDEAYLARGGVKAFMGLYELALSDYNEALRINPRSTTSLVARGAALESIGRLDEALTDYNEAISLRPSLAVVYCYRGNVQRLMGLMEDAVKSYDEAVRLNHNLIEAYLNRAIIKIGLGAYGEAMIDLDYIIKNSPNNAEAYLQKGIALFHTQNIPAARDALERSAAIDPSLRPRVMEIVEEFDRPSEPHFEHDIRKYDEIVANNPDSAEPYANRSLLKSKAGLDNEALKDIDEALKRNPSDNVLYRSRADVRFRLGDIGGAIMDYSQSIALDPLSPDSRFNRAVAYNEIGDRGAATEDFLNYLAIKGGITDSSGKIAKEYSDSHGLYDRKIELLSQPIYKETVSEAIVSIGIYGSYELMLFYGLDNYLRIIGRFKDIIKHICDSHDCKYKTGMGSDYLFTFNDCVDAIAASSEIIRKIEESNNAASNTERFNLNIGIDYGETSTLYNERFGMRIITACAIKNLIESTFVELEREAVFPVKDRILISYVVKRLIEDNPALNKSISRLGRAPLQDKGQIFEIWSYMPGWL